MRMPACLAAAQGSNCLGPSCICTSEREGEGDDGRSGDVWMDGRRPNNEETNKRSKKVQQSAFYGHRRAAAKWLVALCVFGGPIC